MQRDIRLGSTYAPLAYTSTARGGGESLRHGSTWPASVGSVQRLHADTQTLPAANERLRLFGRAFQRIFQQCL